MGLSDPLRTRETVCLSGGARTHPFAQAVAEHGYGTFAGAMARNDLGW